MKKNHTPFTTRVIALISAIPKGKVSTYGAIAKAAGSPKGARQVARILYSCSKSEELPWHRVVGQGGKIRLPGESGSIQRQLLAMEGVEFRDSGDISMKVYGWAID